MFSGLAEAIEALQNANTTTYILLFICAISLLIWAISKLFGKGNE
jgi:hypothetical protein